MNSNHCIPDVELKDIEASQNTDFYKAQASHLFGINYADVTKTERKVAKANTFAMQYECNSEYILQDALNTHALYIRQDDMMRKIAYEIGIRDIRSDNINHSEEENNIISEYESSYLDGLMVGLGMN